MKPESVLFQLMDQMRSGVPSRGLIILALQLVAWVRLSKEGELPMSLRYDREGRNLTWLDLANLFVRIQISKEVREGIPEAFLPYGETFGSLETGNISSVLGAVERLYEGGFIGLSLVDEAISLFGRDKNVGNMVLPDEVAKLMISLAEIEPNDRVYTPFDECLQLSNLIGRAQGNLPETQAVYTEVLGKNPFPWLAKLLSKSAVCIREGDPITAPSYVSQRELEKFDVAVSCPPFGKRFDGSVAKKDLFGRFTEVTTSGNVLAIRHLISQTKRKIVVAVANNLLFSAAAEFSLRKYLVQEGILEAVISLPSALLPGNASPFSILVLNLQKTSEDVLFIDGSATDAMFVFYSIDGKGRADLYGWEKILDLYKKREKGQYSTVVNSSDIQRQEYRLEVSRYCLPDIAVEMDDLLSHSEILPLREIVEIFRPLPTLPRIAEDENTVEVLEVEIRNFPEYGSIREAKKKVRLKAFDVEENAGNFFLRPKDILVSVRGKTGEVAIVSEAAQGSESTPWVASQSCYVLRMNETKGISPEYVFMYLRSEVGRALLKRISSGASVSLIHLGELSKLPVVMPSESGLVSIEGDYQRLEELQDQIIDMEIEKDVLLSRIIDSLRIQE